MRDLQSITGGDFLIKEVACEDIFTPEEWTEEHLMMRQTAIDFVKTRIIPNLDAIDDMQEGLMPSLLEEAGELGLVGAAVPEELGGMGLDFKSSMVVTEGVGGGHSFAVSYTAHTGIATLPILYYGNEDQKKKYLPKLASGEWIGAWGLTEANTGSDAMRMQCVAQKDGDHWVINGTKNWITHGISGDVAVVLVRTGELLDSRGITAFIIERETPGFSGGKKENKLG